MRHPANEELGGGVYPRLNGGKHQFLKKIITIQAGINPAATLSLV